MNPWRDCYLRTHQTLRGHARIFARAYYLRPNNESHMTAGRTMCQELCATLIEPLRPYYPGSGRRSRRYERKLSFPSTSRTLAARRGEPLTNSLAYLDAPFSSAPSWQIPSPRNSWRTWHTGPGIASPPGSSTRSCRPMEDSNTWGSQYLSTL